MTCRTCRSFVVDHRCDCPPAAAVPVGTRYIARSDGRELTVLTAGTLGVRFIDAGKERRLPVADFNRLARRAFTPGD